MYICPYITLAYFFYKSTLIDENESIIKSNKLACQTLDYYSALNVYTVCTKHCVCVDSTVSTVYTSSALRTLYSKEAKKKNYSPNLFGQYLRCC